ncbi:transcriptional regulator domain-containing protein [Bradyrhizobium sp. CCBAU 51745]|uniref:transcriptional regulator domain-containing protein n=1 Tax=Bradyrhizobium sp. CCBAU 51745 TaxID=1325099 RepID=UPI002305843D|nr:DUF6499 domain-containing protein [Bradyrhizobium sp. CCBAU 51745]
MPEFDWRSPDSYKSLQDAEGHDIAWECLRRKADYRRDLEAMIANSPDGKATPESRRRWPLLPPMTRGGPSTSRRSLGAGGLAAVVPVKVATGRTAGRRLSHCSTLQLAKGAALSTAGMPCFASPR